MRSRIEDFNYLLPTERDLVVGSEPITVAILTERGGRFTILAVGQTGRYVAGRCDVLDGDGREIAVTFRSHGGFPMPEPLEPGRLDAAERILCQTVLPPGNYTLQLAFDGYPGRREALRIVAGETTEVRLQLP